MNIKITERDIELFELLAITVWLSSSQIKYALFPDAILKVVNKRTRKLVQAGYLNKVRLTRIDEALYQLAAKGRALLIEDGYPSAGILSMRKPPRELEHFLAINSLRLYFEAGVRERNGEMR